MPTSGTRDANEYVLGVDIGGTKTIVVLFDVKGHLIERRKFSSHSTNVPPLVNICNEIKKCVSEWKLEQSDIISCGIGVPGVVDPNTGELTCSPGLVPDGINITAFLSECLSVPVFIDNDVNMAVQGERWKGIGSGYKNIAFISIGTGIGAGLILDGKVFSGSKGFAGEIGYFPIDPLSVGERRTWSDFGPLETVASGRGLANQVSRYRQTYAQSPLVLIESPTTEQIFDQFRTGDSLAIHLVDSMTKYAAFAIANVIALINPDIIVLGGGVAQAGEDFIPQIESLVWNTMPIRTPIVRTALGEDTGAYGAAATALERMNYATNASSVSSYKVF